MFDVSPDAQRFLMIKESGTDGTVARTNLVVVQHWAEELQAKLPAGK